MPVKQAIKRFEAFHGKRASTISKRVIDFDGLVNLATPELITYKSDKKNGGGNGKPVFFKHKFSKSTRMFCSPDGRMLVIMGPQFKVNSRGLVG